MDDGFFPISWRVDVSKLDTKNSEDTENAIEHLTSRSCLRESSLELYYIYMENVHLSDKKKN